MVNSTGVIASAGVGVAEKVCAFIMLISSAFMQSMSAFVAQNYGAGQITRARKALHYGIAVSFSIGVVMFLITFFHGDALAGIFSSDGEVVFAAGRLSQGICDRLPVYSYFLLLYRILQWYR
ncbi:MAG: MATE family efflux transporter [Roseburia inulinivorans]